MVFGQRDSKTGENGMQKEIKEEDIKLVVSKIKKLAKENGLSVTENVEKIAKAKVNFFGVEQWKCCPCDPNSDRACISSHCKKDIDTDGQCHCRLYRKALK